MVKKENQNFEQALNAIDSAINTLKAAGLNVDAYLLHQKCEIFRQMGDNRNLLKIYEETEDWASLRDFYFQAGDYEKSFHYCTKEFGEICSESYEDFVGDLLVNDKIVVAIDFIDRAIEDGYRDKSYWFNRKTTCLMMLGRYEEALPLYDVLIEAEEQKEVKTLADSIRLYHSKGICLQSLGRYKEAIECYDKFSFDIFSVDACLLATLDAKMQKLVCIRALEGEK
jgi:tetratricopeptide (TPR) repeat protein